MAVKLGVAALKKQERQAYNRDYEVDMMQGARDIEAGLTGHG